MTDVVECLVYATGERVQLPVVRRLASRTTAFQRLELVDTAAFGRCLVLDGVLQAAEADHHLYDDAILWQLGADDRDLLIAGGGGGFVALRAVARVAALRAHLVDIDRELIELCRQHLTPELAAHPRITVEVDDAIAWAERRSAPSYDGVVVDLTDAPLDARHAAPAAELYRRALAALVPLVRPGGWIAVQAGASEVAAGTLHLPALLRPLLAGLLESVEERAVYVPSYGEANAFVGGRRRRLGEARAPVRGRGRRGSRRCRGAPGRPRRAAGPRSGGTPGGRSTAGCPHRPRRRRACRRT